MANRPGRSLTGKSAGGAVMHMIAPPAGFWRLTEKLFLKTPERVFGALESGESVQADIGASQRRSDRWMQGVLRPGSSN